MNIISNNLDKEINKSTFSRDIKGKSNHIQPQQIAT